MPSLSDDVHNTPPFSQVDQRQPPFRMCNSEQLNLKITPSFKKFLIRKSSQKQGNLKKFDFMNIFQEKWNKKNLVNKCKLCEFQFQKQKMTKLSACQHKFCQQCLVQYMKYKINMMEQIVCPQQECSAKLQKNCEIFTSMPQNLRKKYNKSELWRQSMSNPNIRICPSETCEQGFINFSSLPYRCNKCKRQFCRQCMMEKHVGDCSNLFERNYQQWKRCPSCKMFIEKIQGCNHITCRCSHQFCFVCLQRWEQTHYQCTSARQMQFFHSQQIQHPALFYVILIILLPLFFILGIAIVIGLFGIMIGVGVFMGMFYIIGATCNYLCCFAVLLAPIGMIGGAIAIPILFTAQVSVPTFRNLFRRYIMTIRMLNQSNLRPVARINQQHLPNNLIQQQPY